MHMMLMSCTEASTAWCSCSTGCLSQHVNAEPCTHVTPSQLGSVTLLIGYSPWDTLHASCRWEFDIAIAILILTGQVLTLGPTSISAEVTLFRSPPDTPRMYALPTTVSTQFWMPSRRMMTSVRTLVPWTSSRSCSNSSSSSSP